MVLCSSSTVCLLIALPVTGCIFMLLSLVETAGHPYDVVECEPEMVSGYYVDHGGVSFMMIYLAEGIVSSTGTSASHHRRTTR